MTLKSNPEQRLASRLSGPRIRPVLWLLLLLGLAAGAALWRFGRPQPPADQGTRNQAARPLTQPTAQPLSLEPTLPVRPAEASPLARFPAWTNSANAPLISQLLNPALPLKNRRQAARALAQLGSDETLAALKTALLEGPPYLKAAIGEGLGESPHPEAKNLLLSMVNGTDETVARGAIRGLALRGDAEAAETLGQVLFDAQKPDSVRAEAALALGEVQQPAALASLTRAATELQDETLTEQVLEGLGRRPFEETAEFFRSYLESPSLSTESKVAALEALGNAEGNVAPFLLKYAADPDAEVRAAAVWALSATDSESDLGPQLLGLLKQETSPEVRLRLYQALGNQDAWDVPTLLALAEKETDPGVRLAGLAVLAQAVRAAPTPEALSFFNQTAVPELERTALTRDSMPDRLSAVLALRQAGTAEATRALQDVAGQASDRKVAEAAQAALGGPPRR